MPAEAILVKLPNGALAPDSEEGAELLRGFKVGQGIRCSLTRVRNYQFHKKWFALAKYAFDIWADTMPRMEFRGQQVQPNFDRFRKDLIILAGYYEPVFNARGELRVEPKSISFANMGEEEFEKLFSATIDAILQKVLTGTDIDERTLRNHVDNILRFD